MTTGLFINSLFFFAMGLAALVRPAFVVGFVDWEPSTANARNEVRAVYGGFGIAISLVLLLAASDPILRTGISIAVAAALLGMAGGRVISTLLERPGRGPLLFIFVEAGLALLLLSPS